jgi:hypothetical protein
VRPSGRIILTLEMGGWRLGRWLRKQLLLRWLRYAAFGLRFADFASQTLVAWPTRFADFGLRRPWASLRYADSLRDFADLASLVSLRTQPSDCSVDFASQTWWLGRLAAFGLRFAEFASPILAALADLGFASQHLAARQSSLRGLWGSASLRSLWTRDGLSPAMWCKLLCQS